MGNPHTPRKFLPFSPLPPPLRNFHWPSVGGGDGYFLESHNDSELYWLRLGNWVNPVPFKSLYWANWPESWLTQCPNPYFRRSCFQDTRCNDCCYVNMSTLQTKQHNHLLMPWYLFRYVASVNQVLRVILGFEACRNTTKKIWLVLPESQGNLFCFIPPILGAKYEFQSKCGILLWLHHL